MDEFDLIKIESAFPIQKVLQLTIKIIPQQHAVAKVKALLSEDASSLIKRAQQDKVTIKNNENILFCGLISNVKIEYIDNVYYLYLIISSYSVQMDLKKKKRSFQGITSYEEILEQLIKNDAKGDYHLQTKEGEDKKDKFWLQYEETDWEFLKRVSSQVGKVILPNVLEQKLQVFIGLPSLKENCITKCEVLFIHNNPLAKKYVEAETKGLLQRDPLGFYVQIREDYPVGTYLSLSGQVRIITQKRIILRKGRLEYCYFLENQNSCLVLPIWNKHSCGLSLSGIVKEVDLEKSKGKIQLNIDKEEKETYDWFPIVTPYSAGEHMGLALFPQVEEPIELLLSEQEEANGFLRVGARIERVKCTGIEQGKSLKPEIKYIGVTNQTEFMFCPEQIQMNVKHENEDAKITLHLHEKTGITIKTKENMLLDSKENITFHGRKIELEATECVALKKGTSSIVMDNSTHISSKIIYKKNIIDINEDVKIFEILEDGLEKEYDRYMEMLKQGKIKTTELGPAIACAYNKNTGHIFFAINNLSGYTPEKIGIIHPYMRKRIHTMPEEIKQGYIKTPLEADGAGSHAECYALNTALLDDIAQFLNKPIEDLTQEEVNKAYVAQLLNKSMEDITQEEMDKVYNEEEITVNLSDIYVDVLNVRPFPPTYPETGMHMKRCIHCAYITDGVTIHPGLQKTESE